MRGKRLLRLLTPGLLCLLPRLLLLARLVLSSPSLRCLSWLRELPPLWLRRLRRRRYSSPWLLLAGLNRKAILRRLRHLLPLRLLKLMRLMSLGKLLLLIHVWG